MVFFSASFLAMSLQLTFAIVIDASSDACTGCFCDPVYQESEMQVQNDLQYGSAFNVPRGEQEMLLLNLYQPPASDARSLRPAMLSIHGGGFISGDQNKDNFVHWAKNFVANGFVAVSINYRLSYKQTDKQEANTYAMEDAKAAVRWLVKNSAKYRIDPHRIGAFGCSAGAMTVAYLNTVEGEGQSGNPGYPSNISAGVTLSGILQPAKYDEIKDKASPHIDFHGDADDEIPYQGAVATQEAEQQAGMVSELVTLPGKGHCPFGEFENHRSEVMGFLTKHMDLNSAQCPAATVV